MKKTISFVSTIIPADQFKKKYEIGGSDNGETITIYHIGEVLDSEIGAYRCYECSIPTSLFDEDEVKTAFVKFDEKVKAAELAYVVSKKVEEITAYDKSDKVNGFILNGMTVWLDKATRVGLMNSTTIAKAAGNNTTTLWLGYVKLVVDCDEAIRLLSALEMYALECFNVTASHKAAVGELKTIVEVEAYDYKAGYPKMLEMSV